MKQHLISLAVAFAVFFTVVQAQEGKSTTRIEKQHKPTRFMKEHLKQSEASILLSLQGTSVRAQQTAIQTLRDLEQVFPEYPFSSTLIPLETLLKDKKADSVVRVLAALALDELHSDTGDAVIKEVADLYDDGGLQNLCQALLVNSKKE
jgi:hypothetical protein